MNKTILVAILYVVAVALVAVAWHFGWLLIVGQPLPFGLK